MPKRYNTPHRSHVVKTRLTDEEYADFTERLAPYGISQSEFLRQAIRRTTIRPVLHVSSVNDELLSAVGSSQPSTAGLAAISTRLPAPSTSGIAPTRLWQRNCGKRPPTLPPSSMKS